LADSGSATDADFAPFITQLTDAFNVANDDLVAFNSKGGDGKPHNKDELAKVIAGILIVSHIFFCTFTCTSILMFTTTFRRFSLRPLTSFSSSALSSFLLSPGF
jgi:hypothetical protein